MKDYNKTSLTHFCSTVCRLMEIDPPEYAEEPIDWVCDSLSELCKGGFDRVLIHNPDAVGMWLYQDYPDAFEPVLKHTNLTIPMCSVMPSVTPVCFGTMYTGAPTKVHGIEVYERKLITIDTLFDALARAGKKVALLSLTDYSMSIIFAGRDIDYYIYDTYAEINAKAAQLIMEDKHDFIVVYNGNYDTIMHKYGTEATESLGELRDNSHAFGTFDALIQNHWKGHNTLIGFCMDHGCHDIDAGCGSHGLDMDEDLNIVHLFKLHAKEN